MPAISLAPGEKLWNCPVLREPEPLWSAEEWNTGPITVETADDFKGFVVRKEFARGRLPIDQLVRGAQGFIEPVGFLMSDLVRTSELGYFRYDDKAPPRTLTCLAHEMMARAAGLKVLSPRGVEGVVQWDYEQGEIPGRLMVLCKDGQMLTSESGRGDARPELTNTPENCLRTGNLQTTNKTREQALASPVTGGQESLFGTGGRPKLHDPRVPAAFREFQ